MPLRSQAPMNSAIKLAWQKYYWVSERVIMDLTVLLF